MTIINNFTKAITNGVPVTSVRLRQIEDQEWAVKRTKEGQVVLTLGKEVQNPHDPSGSFGVGGALFVTLPSLKVDPLGSHRAPG